MCETSQQKRLLTQFRLHEIIEISEQAVFVAVAETIAAGIPITCMREGQVVSLSPNDPTFDAHRDYLNTGIMPSNRRH